MLRRIAEVVRHHEVHRLPPSATAFDAARLMKAKVCGAVMITRRGRLEGIFTERDLVTRVVAVGLAARSGRRGRSGGVAGNVHSLFAGEKTKTRGI